MGLQHGNPTVAKNTNYRSKFISEEKKILSLCFDAKPSQKKISAGNNQPITLSVRSKFRLWGYNMGIQLLRKILIIGRNLFPRRKKYFRFVLTRNRPKKKFQPEITNPSLAVFDRSFVYGATTWESNCCEKSYTSTIGRIFFYEEKKYFPFVLT